MYQFTRGENLMRFSKQAAFVTALMLLVSACSTVKLDESAPVEDRTGKPVPQITTLPPYPGDPGMSADSKANTTTSSSLSKDPLDNPASVLAKRSIYFDLDSYTVKDEFKPVIEAHAKYLISRKDRKIIIQGNTDERGGSEYNLALGQKRSEAVRRALQLLGVPDTQMEAISLGKEKPKATGGGEEAWAENRRADIVY
jgi:peptidoglycan-associated lipoprotein